MQDYNLFHYARRNLKKNIYIGIGTFLEILAQYVVEDAAVLYKAKIIFFIWRIDVSQA